MRRRRNARFRAPKISCLSTVLRISTRPRSSVNRPVTPENIAARRRRRCAGMQRRGRRRHFDASPGRYPRIGGNAADGGSIIVESLRLRHISVIGARSLQRADRTLRRIDRDTHQPLSSTLPPIIETGAAGLFFALRPEDAARTIGKPNDESAGTSSARKIQPPSCRLNGDFGSPEERAAACRSGRRRGHDDPYGARGSY